MNGARAAAFNFVLDNIYPNSKVLDVGAGSSPLAGYLVERGCDVLAIDVDIPALHAGYNQAGRTYTIQCLDARDMSFHAEFDTVLAIYSLDTMIPYEPLAWVKIRQALKMGGHFLYVGRYQHDAPRMESNRKDPLIGKNEQVIEILATLTGFSLQRFWHYQYSEEGYSYCKDNWGICNAFGAELEAV